MSKRLQYDHDVASEQAELFLHVYNLLKQDKTLKIIYTENLTSFHAPEGGICYLRVKEGKLIVGFFKGAYLSQYADLFTGKGKTMRHLTFTCKEEVDDDVLLEIVQETIIYNIERAELLKMRRC